VTEPLRITLGRHTRYSGAILVNALAKVLALLVEGVVCEDVDDAHEVNVLLVRREQPALILLVEALVLLQVAIAPEVVGVERVQGGGVVDGRGSLVLLIQILHAVTAGKERAGVLGAVVDTNEH